MRENIVKGMRYDLKSEEREQIARQIAGLLEGCEDVVFAYLHGSFAEDLPFGDIDVAVYVQEDRVPRHRLLPWSFHLAGELEKQIGLPVDVQVLNTAPLGFQHSVTNGRVVFSRDEEFRYTWVERVWIAVMDFEYHACQMLKEVFEL
ncbi:MAG: nucleotidyltransferase domain-containing protein [Armatimonadota bacterium]